MLERMLSELEVGRPLSVQGLAARLDTTPELIQMMLEHLQQQGLVQTVEFCEGLCEECPLGSLCASEKRQRLWQTNFK